ncbi:MAG: hypothetical protein ACPLVJ_00615, partial [Candidatus Bathyarchaeales archaeon]
NDPEPVHELLRQLARKGWQIIINFMARDCILGNVAVKIGDKWFAFGQARKDENGEPYVAEIWPIKYVLPNLSKMEIKPEFYIPINYDGGLPQIFELPWCKQCSYKSSVFCWSRCPCNIWRNF